jgi:signal transduction histidine kinase
LRPHADTAVVKPPLQNAALGDLTLGTAALIGISALALPLLALPSDLPGGVAVARFGAVAVPVGFGLYRLTRERRDRFALLLVAAGALYSLTTLAESHQSVLYSLGRTSAWLMEPLIVYLVLSCPSGRLDTPVQRRLFTAVAALVGALYLPTALLAPFPEPSAWASCGQSCPSNAFLVGHGAEALVTDVLQPLREVLSVVLFGAVTLDVGRRTLAAGPILRRTLGPVAVVAALRTATLALYFVARGGPTGFDDAIGWLFVLSVPAVTVSFAVGLFAHRWFAMDAFAQLTRTLPSRPTAAQLRDALRGALGDPRLEILYCVPGGWIDESGWPTAAPRGGAGRAVTEVSAGGVPFAAILHHADLSQNPGLMQAMTVYVLKALDNQHLVDELRSSLDELAASRARLVTVADKERRKIERDLHDGAQQRLVALQIKLELLAERLASESPEGAASIRAIEDDVELTLDEVRRFGHGLYPPLLMDRGLPDALRALARTATVPTHVDVHLPHRCPLQVESAVYFACIEALQNVAKHASAKQAWISVHGNGDVRFEIRDDGVGFDPASVDGGVGTANIRDRIGAVGGTVEIASAPGRGTRVSGAIPAH